MILNKNKKIILISVIIIIVIILLIICYFFINNNSNENNNNNNIKEHFIDTAISKVSIIGGDNNKDPNKFNLLVSSDGLDWRPSSMNWTSNASPSDGGQITIPSTTGIKNLFDKCNAGASGLDENGRALFVIVGYGNNSIAYSYDGVNWVGLGNTIFDRISDWGGGNSVAWNGGMWVAVGSNSSFYRTADNQLFYVGNTAAYSYNGRDWFGAGNNNQTMYCGNYGEGRCVTFIGRTWISGGYGMKGRYWNELSSNLWISNDGINWKPLSMFKKIDNINFAQTINLGRGKINCLAYNEKTLLILYDGGIAYANISTDIIYDSNNNIAKINYNQCDKDTNCVPEIKDNNGNSIIYGVNKTTVSDPGAGYKSVVWGGPDNNKMWIAVGNKNFDFNQSIIYSTDGINWIKANCYDKNDTKDVKTPLFNGSANGISWNGSLWIATGGSKGDTIATSTDGINWTKVPNSINLIYDGNFVISGINASLIKLPTTTQPTTTQPTTTQPTTTRPTTTRPTTTRPTTTRPTTTQPTSTRPTTTTQPTSTRPTTTQATFATTSLDIIISQPTFASTQPTSTQPTSTQPTSTQPTSTQPTSTQPTSTQPTSTQPTSTQPTSTQPTSTRPTSAQPINILSSVGPCSRIEIISDNMNFAGLLILNQFGNNIFNNDYITTELNDISGNIVSTILSPLSSSASMSTIANSNTILNVKNAFSQTYNMILNNIDNCKFDSDNIDTINIPNATNLNNNYNICNKPNYIINPNDSSKIFTTSSGTNTNLSINIPQIANTNIPLPTNMQINNISKIIFCMIKNINNDDMINSLKINIYDLNNKPIAEWNDIRTIISTNFLTLALPPLISNTIPNSTQTNVARFIDIKKSYFSDVFANKVSYSNYYPASVNTSFTTMPNSSTSTTMPSSSTSTTMGNLATSTTMGNSLTSTTMGNSSTSTTMGNLATSSTMGNSSTSCKNEVKGIFPELQSITSFMNDIKSMFPDISQNQIKELIDAGIDINKLKANNEIINNNESINDNGNVLNSKGIHLSNNFKGPSTNIMQVDFTGTSNIYSPYLYYNKATTEKFNSVK
jgi:hypothetical protein